MVRDHSIGSQEPPTLFVSVVADLLDPVEDWEEEIGLIVRLHTLQDGDDPFKAHPGVYVSLRQRFKRSRARPVVLDEHEIPKLQEPVAVAIHRANVPLDLLLVAVFRSKVVVDFAIWS